jgi:iron complex outermembrane recepter protein
MYKSLFALIFLFIYQTSFGQNPCGFTIRGKVVHEENNEPIAGAYILLIEPSISSSSDNFGNFRITNLCEGTYTLKVVYLGHQEYVNQVTINTSSNITVRLRAEDYELEGIEIHGHKDALLTSNAISAIYGEELLLSRGLTLGETLKKIPGVTTYATGSTIQKPVINGLHSNRVLIMHNGVRLEGQQWGVEHAPELDPFIAKEIAVIKGAETVRFGPDAMGGVILVNPASLPLKEGTNGEIDLISQSNGRGISGAAMIQGGSAQVKGLGYRIQGSSKVAGNLHTPDYMLANTGVRELNFSGAIGYSNSTIGSEIYVSHFQTNIGILADAHTGNLSDLTSIIDNGQPFRTPSFTYDILNPRQQVQHQLVKAKFHAHLNHQLKLNVQYSFQRNERQEFDRRRGELNDRPALDLELYTNSLDISIDHQSKRKWNGSTGLQLVQQANSNIPGTGVTPLIPNYDMWNLGLFAIQKYVSGPLELEGGLRFDYRTVSAARYIRNELETNEFQFRNVSAFFGGVYALGKNSSIRSNLGTAWRPPNINEQFSQGLHHGIAAIEIGNPDFVSEQSYQWMNTYSWENSRWKLELSAFTNSIQNYIYIAPTNRQFVSLRGTFNVFEYQQTNALLTGGDVYASYDWQNGLVLFTRGSIVRAKDTVNDAFLPFIPTDRIETGLSFRLDKPWKPSFTISNLSVAQQSREPEFDLAPAPAGYSVWNAGFQSALILGKNTLNLGIQVQNLLDVAYRDYMNRFRYFSHELGRNVFVKLNYEF